MLRRTYKMLKPFLNKDVLEAGIDEAGRGPLFGRVYTAAVILPQDETFIQPFIRDSKRLSVKKREIAFNFIKENCIDYAVTYKDHDEIDTINIYNATYSCMHDSLDKLLVRPEYILVDGSEFQIYTEENEIVPHKCLVKGDDLYSPIAAASIMAKVSRDKWIKEMCEKYPLLDEYYDLSSNKGYGTKTHLEGIKKYGISPWHRKSFGICKGRMINSHFK